MSRAFRKEADDAPEPPVVLPHSQHPNYVTPTGLEQLRARLAAAQSANDEREVSHLRERIESAIVQRPNEQTRNRVQFGSTVTIADSAGTRQRYSIVGEDEADPLHGKISWLSPLAQALLEQRKGARVMWQRPAGDMPVTILDIV